MLTIYKPEYPGYAENPTYENNCREMMGIWRENGWVDFSFISGDYLWADKEQIEQELMIDLFHRLHQDCLLTRFQNTVKYMHGHSFLDIHEKYVNRLIKVLNLMMTGQSNQSLWGR